MIFNDIILDFRPASSADLDLKCDKVYLREHLEMKYQFELRWTNMPIGYALSGILDIISARDTPCGTASRG